MDFKYGARQVDHGNSRMTIGQIAQDNQKNIIVQNLIRITGLSSVGAFENQASSEYIATDDEPAHALVRSKSYFSSSLTLKQLDEAVKLSLLGWEKDSETGNLSPMANFREVFIQFTRTAKRRKNDGTAERGVQVYLLPRVQVETDDLPESETDGQSVSTLDYEIPFYAFPHDLIRINNEPTALIFNEYWGAEAKTADYYINDGGVIIAHNDPLDKVPRWDYSTWDGTIWL
jgi:hypothetical protein